MEYYIHIYKYKEYNTIIYYGSIDTKTVAYMLTSSNSSLERLPFTSVCSTWNSVPETE